MATSEPIYSTKSKVQQEFYKYFQAEEKGKSPGLEMLNQTPTAETYLCPQLCSSE